MTTKNLDLARECFADVRESADGQAVVEFYGDELDAFAERIQAESAGNFDISQFQKLEPQASVQAQVGHQTEPSIHAGSKVIDGDSTTRACPGKKLLISALLKAALRVLSWTESGHRPPVRQALRCGEMARVRIHALCDLHEAVIAITGEPESMRPEESARLNLVLAQVFGWNEPNGNGITGEPT